ncbi:MAG: LacI family DNA-binding transcriptional regulator [Terriglobales bacterium]
MQTEQRGGKRKVTLGDVAKESAVSVTTASLVISNGPAASRFPLPTRERIWKVARRLGYRPNFFARSLRQSRSQTLGILLFDITDPYCTQILRGIESRIRLSGYFSLITDLQNNGTQFHPCIEMLMDRQVEGIIAVANPVYLAPDLFAEFIYRQIPTVVIGRDLHGNPVSSISVDNEAGARQALQYLYQLGHTRIAFIKGPKALSDSEPRWRGIKSFAHEVGLKLEPNLIANLKGPNSTYAEAYRLAEELIKRDSEFTALVAFDDLTACAAIRALTKAGREVPKDCSVLGFDDIPSGAFYNPPLTTVQQQLEVQGFLGAEVIEDLIKAKFESRIVQPRHHMLEPRLIVRDSTCPAPPS